MASSETVQMIVRSEDVIEAVKQLSVAVSTATLPRSLEMAIAMILLGTTALCRSGVDAERMKMIYEMVDKMIPPHLKPPVGTMNSAEGLHFVQDGETSDECEARIRAEFEQEEEQLHGFQA